MVTHWRRKMWANSLSKSAFRSSWNMMIFRPIENYSFLWSFWKQILQPQDIAMEFWSGGWWFWKYSFLHSFHWRLKSTKNEMNSRNKQFTLQKFLDYRLVSLVMDHIFQYERLLARYKLYLMRTGKYFWKVSCELDLKDFELHWDKRRELEEMYSNNN